MELGHERFELPSASFISSSAMIKTHDQGVQVRFFLGGLVSLFTLTLFIGAITGRVKMTNCCSAGDPSQDLRMNPKFDH